MNGKPGSASSAPSQEDALRAKATLRDQLGRPQWLRGIGVSDGADGGYCVLVNVAELTPEIRRAVPESIEGVPVRIDVVGDIRA